PGWKNHIETIPGYYDYYVRLHILSEKLGGSGRNKTNLTPGRKTENRNMEQQAETPADDLITDDRRVLWYEGKVTGYRSEPGFTDFAKGIQVQYGFMEQKNSDDWARVGSVQYSNTFSVTKPDPKGSRDPIPNINTMPGNHWDDIKHLDHAPTREVFRNMVKDIEEEGDFSSFGAFENSQAYENAKKEHPTLDSFFQEAFDEGLIRKP
ncbi:MAG: hypothetical protein KGY70_16830, partial [Bacteroidales bacterium]|nr:hypothetical protein [Bacteroidales bacterium]